MYSLDGSTLRGFARKVVPLNVTNRFFWSNELLTFYAWKGGGGEEKFPSYENEFMSGFTNSGVKFIREILFSGLMLGSIAAGGALFQKFYSPGGNLCFASLSEI